MICEGKRAKVRYCKKAVCSAPVPAEVRYPVNGQARNGMENARTVAAADIAEPMITEIELHGGEPPTRVKQVSKKAPRVQNRTLQSASEDITLKKLFQKNDV